MGRRMCNDAQSQQIKKTNLHHSGSYGRLERPENEPENQQARETGEGRQDHTRRTPSNEAEDDPVIDLEANQRVYRYYSRELLLFSE